MVDDVVALTDVEANAYWCACNAACWRRAASWYDAQAQMIGASSPSVLHENAYQCRRRMKHWQALERLAEGAKK